MPQYLPALFTQLSNPRFDLVGPHTLDICQTRVRRRSKFDPVENSIMFPPTGKCRSMSNMTKVVLVPVPLVVLGPLVVFVVMGNKDPIEIIPFPNGWIERTNIGHAVHLAHIYRSE